MITAKDAAAVVDDTVITSLDVSMFTPKDVENLILQRSEVLWDVPRSGRVVKEWSEGDPTRMLQQIADRSEVLIRRAAAFIYQEFESLRPTLDTLAVGRVADIGCGYAMFDLFLARAYGSDIILIDIEQNDERHFGYRETGAAYTSLDQARVFLTANGVPNERITTCNPEKDDLDQITDLDLATSFVSCGYHYPVATYAAFFDRAVKPGGAILLDVRRRARKEQRPTLNQLGQAEFLGETSRGTGHRMLYRKVPA
ncbi:MAG: hypothetical protein ACPGVA_01805 [Pikeienuella sp.]